MESVCEAVQAEWIAKFNTSTRVWSSEQKPDCLRIINTGLPFKYYNYQKIKQKRITNLLEVLGENACSSLTERWTLGEQTGGEVTRIPPLGSVLSSEDVLTSILMVSKGGMTPRLTTSTVLSWSSSITICPAARWFISKASEMYSQHQWKSLIRFCMLTGFKRHRDRPSVWIRD